jgi:hypothetical protein
MRMDLSDAANVISKYRPLKCKDLAERRMRISKNTRRRASCLAVSLLSMWTNEIQGHSGDCASMNKSSSHSLLQSAIKRATVSSQRVAVVTCEPAELLEYGHGMGVEIAIFGAFLCRERVLAGHQPSLVTRRSITGWISTVAFCKERSQHVRSFSW